jgi:hypothetical protein
LFDVTAFGAIEPAKFKSCGSRCDTRKPHARSAFRAAESLDREQWDCGWVIGHCIPPWVRRERNTLSHRQMPKWGGDGTSMIFGFQSRWSILLTFQYLMNLARWNN